jgi:sugar O-acyltransferase (sialic acid O-acetyltransferase NeuD family)
MKLKELIVVGAGGHAKSCIDIVESVGEYSIAQIIGQESELGLSLLGHTILHTDSDLAKLRHKYEYAFIAVGQIESPETRKRLHQTLSALGYKLPTIFSKSAVVSRYAKVGFGSIVMNGTILNADCVIGENVILNSGSIIEHDAFVGDYCHVSTRVTINGGARIGGGTFLGSGSVVRDNIEIGENSFIGIGSVITKSLPSNTSHKVTI